MPETTMPRFEDLIPLEGFIRLVECRKAKSNEAEVFHRLAMEIVQPVIETRLRALAAGGLDLDPAIEPAFTISRERLDAVPRSATDGRTPPSP